jgi:RHS repeat-associated protein
LRGILGNQDTEINGQGNWVHTNVFSGGELTATAWNAALPSGWNPTLSYDYSNWLGSKRMQASGAVQGQVQAQVQAYWLSDPFGDYLTQFGPGPDATEHHFTGKERDTESGNDYFGARYYASSMGRFMSPDPIKLTDERLLNPANTLNLYSYAANNPLKFVDPDGQDITYFYDQGGVAGHAMLFAYDQQTGDSAIEDFGPTRHMRVWWGSSMHETPTFTSADDIRHQTAALTIQANPELTQQVID